MIKNWLLLPLLVFVLTSCDQEDKRNQTGGRRQVAQVRDNQFTPESSGGDFEVLLVNDKIRKDSSLQRAVSEIFRTPYPALPQPEAWFITSNVNAKGFNKLHRRHKSVLMLSVIPNDKRTNRVASEHFFDQKELQGMASNKGISLRHKWDVHAKPQLAMMLTAPSRRVLLDSLPKYRSTILKWFNKQETRVLEKKVYSGGTKKGLVDELSTKAGYYFLLPMGYSKERAFFSRSSTARLQKAGINHFAWYSQGTDETVSNVMTYEKSYTESLFSKKGLIKLRNQVSKQFVEGAGEDVYMAVEDRYTDVPLIFEKQTLNDRKVYTLKGLWRMKNDFMGGPFRLYAIPDKANDRIIFIDGFVYAAGEDKKPLMKRVEAIMQSFKLEPSS
jgi:hypothetical protein